MYKKNKKIKIIILAEHHKNTRHSTHFGMTQGYSSAEEAVVLT